MKSIVKLFKQKIKSIKRCVVTVGVVMGIVGAIYVIYAGYIITTVQDNFYKRNYSEVVVLLDTDIPIPFGDVVATIAKEREQREIFDICVETGELEAASVVFANGELDNIKECKKILAAEYAKRGETEVAKYILGEE